MERYKYLFKNIGLLTLSSLSTKLLSFFLLPLYTNILSTTDYGTYDLFNTTIGVLLPILTFNIQEAVMRFSLDDKYDKKSIVTVATRYLFFSNIVVIIGLIINNLFDISIFVSEYSFFFFLMFLTQSISGVITMYVRGIDKISELSISSVIASLITICLNILFLAVFHWGLMGYFSANIIGPLIQCIYLIYRTNIVRNINMKERFSFERNEMINYSRPLIANSIAWWVNNASDRFIIVFFCGLAENGIYSVASKIPSILNIFQAIFNQAWTLSAVKDFDPDDKEGFFTNTYMAYNCLMVIICSGLIATDRVLAKMLFAKDFYVAWKYVPWLTIAILFGALSGYLGGFFAAVKDSKIFAQSTVYGAITNVILNFIFVPFLGVLGAAIATTISYVEVWILRYWHSKQYVRIQINLLRDSISYFLLVVQSLLLLAELQIEVLYTLEIVLFVVIVILYFKDITMVLNKFRKSVIE